MAKFRGNFPYPYRRDRACRECRRRSAYSKRRAKQPVRLEIQQEPKIGEFILEWQTPTASKSQKKLVVSWSSGCSVRYALSQSEN